MGEDKREPTTCTHARTHSRQPPHLPYGETGNVHDRTPGVQQHARLTATQDRQHPVFRHPPGAGYRHEQGMQSGSQTGAALDTTTDEHRPRSNPPTNNRTRSGMHLRERRPMRGHCDQRTPGSRATHVRQKHDTHTLPTTRGTFAEEMKDLMQRQQPSGARKRNTTASQVGIPISAHPSIMRVVRDHLGCSHERHTTPLTVSGTSCTSDSEHEGDQAFGATGQPYTHNWAGASVALLPHDDIIQRQAVRWAAMSAHDTTTPAITVLLLPRKSAQEGKPEYM